MRRFPYLTNISGLNDSTIFHDKDFTTQSQRSREIMRDHQYGGAKLPQANKRVDGRVCVSADSPILFERIWGVKRKS